MAKARKKSRKKKTSPQQSRPTTIHRYTAEVEEKQDKRKKLKIKGIISVVVLGIGLGIGLLINFFVF